MIKNKIFFLVFFSILVLSSISVYSQNQEEFESQIDTLVKEFMYLKTLKYNSDIKIVAHRIDSIFIEILSNESSFVDSLSDLKNYSSILLSDDKKVRVITWNTYNESGEFYYYGYIQFYSEKNDEFHFVRLFDESENIINSQSNFLDQKKWFGCLYYEIITTRYKKNKYYTLLGWDGNNFTTNKKIVEVLTLKKDKPKFGFDFELGNKKNKRLIFEYNQQAAMTLRWDKRNKMIIWDHLAPISQKYIGMPEYYGPDFSHDAIKFKKGKWLFYEDIDIKNPKN